MSAVNLANGRRRSEHAGLNAWLARCRLNGLAMYMRGVRPDDTEKIVLVQSMRAESATAETKLRELLAAHV
jgi:hypothetical protein